MNNFRYTNQKCAVCGEVFTESDDIVVCPLCATPHHRECYKKNGECGNSDRHSEGFVWAPEQVPEVVQESSPDTQESTPDTQAGANQQMPPYASPQYPMFAPYPVAQGQNPHFPNPLNAFPPELDDGVQTVDASAYLRQGNFSYLQKFFLEKSGKRTFNIWAFLFGGLWFIYRKMYKLGAIFIALSLVISSARYFVPQYVKLTNELNAISVEYSQTEATPNDVLSELNEMYSKMVQTIKKYPIGMAADIICTVGGLAFSVYLGFIANKKYKEKVIKDIKEINSADCNEELRRLRITSEGGRSLPWALAAILLMNLASFGLSALSEFIIK